MYHPSKVKRFDFPVGKVVGGKYEIERPLGSGWEGEVYAIVERSTGIRRAAKFYYPHRDPTGKAAIAYAQKLDALRHCPILLQYHHQEIVTYHRKKVMAVISELVEGQKLSEFLSHRHNGNRLNTFEALHILYALVKGIAPIHARGEYHGDIHDDNIIIRRQGISFDVKLIDFFDLGRPTRNKIRKDVLNLVEVFHAIVGGRDRYARQPKLVKDIIRGLKDSLILARFQSAGDIQRHLESLEWNGL
jgi:tRNA A-37 threonylcarbamoyl transferase component Bud32